MKFKNKQDYLNQRTTLMNTIEKMMNTATNEEIEAKMQEVEAMDNAWADQAKEMANKAALEDKFKVLNLENQSVDVTGKIIDSTGDITLNDEKEPKAYRNAWAKDMLGMKLTDEESKAFKFVNEAFTHTTENTGVVIPETVVAGIWKEVGEQYPLWNDVFKTFVKGKVTLLKSDTSSKASWYDEATETEDGKETFAEATLNGCELSRDITVSWKLQEMAIEDFIPFIQSQLSEKMGAALGYGVTNGKGQPGETDTFKPEPKGIITTLNGEKDTPQVITYSDADPLTYKKCTKAMSLIKGAYKQKTAIYANGTTIWNELANIVDTTGRPYFVANPIDGGVGTIFGKVVKEDDSIPEGNVLFGDAYSGYHANINKQVSLDSEDHKKKRETDYIAYAIADGGVRSTKAFALIKKG